MSDFKRRILASRETTVESGKFKFRIRRIADLPLARLREANAGRTDFLISIVRESVVGWDGVLEEDLAPGGGDQPVDFESDVFMTWVEDRPEIWADVLNAALAAIERDREKRAAAGNA